MVPAPPPHKRLKRSRVAFSASYVLLALLATSTLGSAAPAVKRNLWGYGVRSCDTYLAAVKDAGDSNPAELQRYEDWLTGFVSGLNLALGESVLRGSGLQAAMRGTQDYCRKHGDQDFFNAAMDHVRGLSGMR